MPPLRNRHFSAEAADVNSNDSPAVADASGLAENQSEQVSQTEMQNPNMMNFGLIFLRYTAQGQDTDNSQPTPDTADSSGGSTKEDESDLTTDEESDSWIPAESGRTPAVAEGGAASASDGPPPAVRWLMETNQGT